MLQPIVSPTVGADGERRAARPSASPASPPEPVGPPLRLIPVVTEVRYCSRCRRDWPPDTESCPNCLLWLGRAGRQRRRYRVELSDDRRPGLDSTRSWGSRLVLCLDLSVATAPDAAAAATLSAFLRRFTEVVLAHGGELVRSHDNGRGTLALFPDADSDGAAFRGLDAALALRAEVQPLAEQVRRLDAAGKLALNVGPVYRDGLTDPPMVRGGVVTQACRLAASALPGTVVASQAIFQRVSATYDLYAVGLPDRALTEPAFVVAGVKQPTSHRFSEQHLGPLVGRWAELAVLRRALELLHLGRSANLSLIAEPGLGKTKLLTHWVRSSDEQGQLSGVTVCEGLGVSYANSPGALLRTLLRRSAANGHQSEDLRDVIADPALSGESQLLARFARGELPAPRALATALNAYFDAISGPGGLILILDDLHWVDDFSLQVLESALARPARRRLVIFSFRPSAEHRLRGLVSDSTRLRLKPLAAAEADALVRLRLDDREVDPELVRELERRSRGNPLYLQEALALLQDTGELAVRGARWELTARIDELELPDTVPGVILARIDHLFQHDLAELRRRHGLAMFERDSVLAAILDIEGKVGAWLDRLETIDLDDRLAIAPHLRRLEQLDFELLLLRMQLGKARPRNARLAAAVSRLESGSLETIQQQLAQRLANHDVGAVADALYAAERAQLRGARATAIELYRLALSGAGLPTGYSRSRLVQDLAQLEYQDGQFASAKARLMDALRETAGDARLQPLLGLAEIDIEQGDWADARRLLVEARRMGVQDSCDSQRFVVLTLELAARTGKLGRVRWWVSRLDWERLSPWLATRAAVAVASAWSDAGKPAAARRWLWRAVDAIPDDSQTRICSRLSNLIESLVLESDAEVFAGVEQEKG